MVCKADFTVSFVSVSKIRTRIPYFLFFVFTLNRMTPIQTAIACVVLPVNEKTSRTNAARYELFCAAGANFQEV